jgi:hypothetical protein
MVIVPPRPSPPGSPGRHDCHVKHHGRIHIALAPADGVAAPGRRAVRPGPD